MTFHEYLRKYYESRALNRLFESWDDEEEEEQEDEDSTYNPISSDPSAPFKQIIPASAVKDAKAKWADIVKTRDGQKQCLKAAGEEDDWAATIYLYNRYLGLTCKAFWKYYVMGDRSELRAYNDEAKYKLAHAALLLLHGIPQYIRNTGESEANPFRSFKAEKYKAGKDILDSFGFWYARYFKDVCLQEYQHPDTAGVTNYSGAAPLRTASYDELAPNDENGPNSPASLVRSNDLESVSYIEDPEQRQDLMNLRAILNDFEAWLKAEKTPDYMTVWVDFLADKSARPAAEKLNTSIEEIHRMRANLKNWLKKRYPQLEEMYQNQR